MIRIELIKESDLDNIKGGSIIGAIGTGLVITAIIVFISGIIEGITNPGKCGE